MMQKECASEMRKITEDIGKQIVELIFMCAHYINKELTFKAGSYLSSKVCYLLGEVSGLTVKQFPSPAVTTNVFTVLMASTY